MKTIPVNRFISKSFSVAYDATKFNSTETIQERLLRFQFSNLYSPYEELLTEAGKTTMLISRLKVLYTEIYKTMNCINPEYMKEIFAKSQSRSSLRFLNNLEGPRVNQATCGTKNIRVAWSEHLECFNRKFENFGFVSGNLKGIWNSGTAQHVLAIFANVILPNEF